MIPTWNTGRAIPGVNTGRGIGIIETIALMGIADGAILLEGSSAWTTGDAAALRHWYAQYLDWMLTSAYGEGRARRQKQSRCLVAGAGDRLRVVHRQPFGKRGNWRKKERTGWTARSWRTGRCRRNWQGRMDCGTALIICRLFLPWPRWHIRWGVDLWHYSNQTNAGIRAAFDWLIPVCRRGKEMGVTADLALRSRRILFAVVTGREKYMRTGNISPRHGLSGKRMPAP